MEPKRFREIFTRGLQHLPIHFTSLPVTSPLVCFASGGSWMSKSPASLGEFGGSVHALVSLLPSSAWPLQMPCQCLSDSRPKAVPRIGVQGALPLQLCFCAFSRKFVLSNLPYVAKTRSTLPRKPTVTPLLQGACYSPFLNGSNFWTSGIMIHEAV